MLSAPSAAFADAGADDILIYKDAVPTAVDQAALMRLEAIAARRLAPLDSTASITSPTSFGLFTPRNIGSQLSLYERDAGPDRTYFGVSLISIPVALSGVSPSSAFVLGSDDDQAYNLGLSVDFARFQVDAALSRMTDIDYDFGLTGLGLDMRYLGDSWQTTLALSGTQATNLGLGSLGRGLGLVHDESYAVEWGASYLLTPRLSLGGSLRLSTFRDDVMFGDRTTTDSSIFLGTNLKF
ncbi:MAG: hypothetical protein ACFBZ9_00120 [Sphingomonadales bacterium]